ncbi:hypothetical protein A3842_09085 [Paenibacillus sp. P3E]|nr:hypothetical protein A3842_09085 [Paenibacillus sp. P3E]
MDNTILVVRIVNGKDAGEFTYFDMKDVNFIDLWSPKKNYRVPRFHTDDGEFTVLLTLEACEKAFAFLTPLDSGNLVNLGKISYATEKFNAITVFFPNGSSTSVAKYKRDLIHQHIKKL